jgi:hypothetical protein
MCECATRNLESAVDYSTLQRSVALIENGTTDVPWWDKLQADCKRSGAGSPPYIAPAALDYLQVAAPAASYPPTFADQFASSCESTGSAHGFKNIRVICACALSKAEATIPYTTAAAELAAGTLGKDERLLAAMIECLPGP